MVVGRSLVQHFGGRTDKAAGDTTVQPERDDIAGTMGALARPDIAETLEPYRTHGIEIPDDGGRPIHLLHDVAQLEAVEELAMAEMHIGDGDTLKGNDLRQARRHPARQDRVRQADGGGLRKRVRAPGRQAIDARLHGMADEMPAHQRRQRDDVFGTFLEQQQVRMLAFHQLGNILHPCADPAQQIPADHPETPVAGMGGKSADHGTLLHSFLHGNQEIGNRVPAKSPIVLVE